MTRIGAVESLWRYPVKSMAGEELEELFLGFSGAYGDRLFAFTTSEGPDFFPFMTARTRAEMLRFRPRFRHPEQAARPRILEVTERLGAGLTPLYADADSLAVEVETPDGEVIAVDDPRLLPLLGDPATLALVRSDRALTDCRPVSLFSVQTVRALEEESGLALDKRRFRANICADLSALGAGFAEDTLVGQQLRIGDRAVIAITDRDPRCQMITLDPDSAEASPVLLERVVHGHEGMAGVYGAVLVEGMVHRGDMIELRD